MPFQPLETKKGIEVFVDVKPNRKMQWSGNFGHQDSIDLFKKKTSIKLATRKHERITRIF